MNTTPFYVPQVNFDKNYKINLLSTVADKSVEMVWGKGYSFKSDIKEIKDFFNNIDKNVKGNNFQYLTSISHKNKAQFGRNIITINRTKTGEIKLWYADLFGANSISKVFFNETAATIYQTVNIDNKKIVLISIFDNKKVKKILADKSNKNIIYVIARAKILKEL